ncbi:MAG TPA: DUF2125 domain-containing protein [Paenirhodobacter sp.]
MRILRWGAMIAVLSAILVAGISWFGSQEITRRAQAALTGMTDLGRARGGAVTAAGFPVRIGVQVQDLALLGAPQVETPRLVATAPLWNPLDWSGDLALPMVVTTGGMRFNVTGTSARVGVRPGYGADWPVRATSLALLDPAATYEAAGAPSLTAKALNLVALQQDGAAYRIHAAIDALALPPGLAASLTPTARFPDTIETVTADALVTFSTPFTLTPQPAPQIDTLQIDMMRLIWGGHQIALSGTLTVDPAGQPEGTLQLRVQDWQQWLEFAQGALRIDRRAMPVLMILGNTLSRATGDGTIVAPLVFRDGQMALGPVPLGPAPVLR